MCATEVDCGTQASCVAGRCVARGATAAIDTARRLVFAPEDLAYLTPGGDRRDPSIGVLGSLREPRSLILLRFAVPLPPEANVLEAYLVLERATEIDADPGQLMLHTARIVDPWDSRSVSWPRQPRLHEAGAPVTPVTSTSGPLVRLDVRTIVQRWRRRSGDDFGVAILAEGATPTGIALALAPLVGGSRDPFASLAPTVSAQPLSPFDPHPVLAASMAEPRRERSGPRLELYLR
jgi:hypothetical protein